MSIGSKIFELRTLKKLSQGDLADMLNVSRQSVSKWETDSAVPDLDKLMKLCDVFGITLDELTERIKSENAVEKIESRSRPTHTQKKFGYIFFGLALLGGLLPLFLFYLQEGDFMVLVPLSISFFICSMICLFLEQRAFYWCIWTLLAPITIVSPYLRYCTLSVCGTIQICCIAVMFFVTLLFFKSVFVSVSRKKGILLISLWISIVILYMLNFILIYDYYILFFLFSFIIFAFMAGLETYTVCYIQSLKHEKMAAERS